MRSNEVLARCPSVVKELSEGLNGGQYSLEEVERRIQTFLNELGQAMEREAVAGLREPTQENSLKVGERIAVYAGKRNLRFRDRFGGKVVLARRCYKFRDAEGGGWAPLDEKLGLDRCKGYSPLMSYLIGLFGVSEPFDRGAELLSEVIGFPISATAVQGNTEAVGERIPDNPYALIGSERSNQVCEVMVVEVDGTISPQILEKQGVVGREKLEAAHGLERVQRGGHSETARWKGGGSLDGGPLWQAPGV